MKLRAFTFVEPGRESLLKHWIRHYKNRVDHIHIFIHDNERGNVLQVQQVCDEIEQVGPNCAYIKEAAQIDMRVIRQLHAPGSQVGRLYTQDGENAVRDHEDRRVSVARKTYDRFFTDVQLSGRHVSKCECICRGTFRQAKSDLKKYLNELRQEAYDTAWDYWSDQNGEINAENYRMEDENNNPIPPSLSPFDHYRETHDPVDEPPDFSPKVECPGWAP